MLEVFRVMRKRVGGLAKFRCREADFSTALLAEAQAASVEMTIPR
jgi:hypothetical protein